MSRRDRQRGVLPPYVGQIVHKDMSYSAHPGKIVRVVSTKEVPSRYSLGVMYTHTDVEVKWINGKTTVESIGNLVDSKNDLAEWKKTYDTCRKAVQKAEAL